jgi:hypothetical protein
MSLPPVPQRPLPPVHHVWVAGPGDGRRLYRTTLIRTSGLRRLAVLWAISLALLVVSAVLDPSHNVTWLLVAMLFPVLFGFLLWRRSKAQEAIMAPGSVWATGFGANELLIITPISTLVIDYAALKPPQIAGSSVLIRTRHGVSASSLPLELFPPDALTFLQQRTAQSP